MNTRQKIEWLYKNVATNNHPTGNEPNFDKVTKMLGRLLDFLENGGEDEQIMREYLNDMISDPSNVRLINFYSILYKKWDALSGFDYRDDLVNELWELEGSDD